MVNLMLNIMFMVAGLLMMLFCKTIAEGTSSFYYILFRHRFSIKGYQIGFFIVGIIFISFAILSLLGIIKFK